MADVLASSGMMWGVSSPFGLLLPCFYGQRPHFGVIRSLSPHGERQSSENDQTLVKVRRKKSATKGTVSSPIEHSHPIYELTFISNIQMTKHSKNNTASSIFSYAEYKKLDYGTKRVCFSSFLDGEIVTHYDCSNV